MRYRKLSKWDNVAECHGLVYFAQMVEEMLFDYTLDTYRPSVMNTYLLCNEGLQTLKEIENGTIMQPNLKHVTAELCDCFEKDPVAHRLVALPPASFYPILKNPKSTLNEIRTVLELLLLQLNSKSYRRVNEELLVQELTGGKSFPIIRRLTRSYVTTLISNGYHQKYLNEKTLDFFYFGANRINGSECMRDYVALFNTEKIEFNVIFRVSNIFENFASTLANIKLIITRDLPEGIDASRFSEFRLRSARECFALLQNVPAKDVYGARNKADSIIKLASTLLTLFHHKESPVWLEECVVHNTKDNSYKKIAKPINSMHKCSDLHKTVANSRLKLFLNDFSLEQNSFIKFIRSTQLHSMALASNTDENQLLNLWISLESLIPSETKSGDTSNIEHISNSMIPFLNIGYMNNLIENLVKDLLRWNTTSFKTALKPIDGRKLTDRLVKVLTLPEYAVNLAALEGSLNDFHLLRDRVNHMKDILSSPGKVIATLDAHWTRVEWQIRRIYRVRNIIVHSGNTPPYTKPLIEHTHGYLDTILAMLVRLASKPKSVHSVSQGFKYIELQYKLYYKKLSEKGITFTRDNIDELIFAKY